MVTSVAASRKELKASLPLVGLSPAEQRKSVLLATTLIRLTTPAGFPHVVRGILDSAAQCSFISERCAQLLNAARQRTTSGIGGISQSPVKSHGIANLSFSSISDPTFDVPSPIDVLIGADLFPYVFNGLR
ncbi:hypothetical protein J437_LFUL019171 [Ladona fulva]|uniref:Uncharacterized protein n=1 Tax=Ladona fulva TaxID=123851 RepID=A0A8K0P456_LADFU|nr:hypothetical protein J437_LFUL019171 [Ladona fulva]